MGRTAPFLSMTFAGAFGAIVAGLWETRRQIDAMHMGRELKKRRNRTNSAIALSSARYICAPASKLRTEYFEA